MDCYFICPSKIFIKSYKKINRLKEKELNWLETILKIWQTFITTPNLNFFFSKKHMSLYAPMIMSKFDVIYHNTFRILLMLFFHSHTSRCINKNTLILLISIFKKFSLPCQFTQMIKVSLNQHVKIISIFHDNFRWYNFLLRPPS